MPRSQREFNPLPWSAQLNNNANKATSHSFHIAAGISSCAKHLCCSLRIKKIEATDKRYCERVSDSLDKFVGNAIACRMGQGSNPSREISPATWDLCDKLFNKAKFPYLSSKPCPVPGNGWRQCKGHVLQPPHTSLCSSHSPFSFLLHISSSFINTKTYSTKHQKEYKSTQQKVGLQEHTKRETIFGSARPMSKFFSSHH